MTDLVIVGAGPYGLSLAAFLRNANADFRIFGTPMQSWASQMPEGMHLKSDGFASDLFDPGSTFTLRHYCAEHGIPYADVGLPVARETFVAYGLEFQKRLVPNLEQVNITFIRQLARGFELQTSTGETFQARRVVVAAGITHFSYIPEVLSALPPEYLSHSLKINQLGSFSGRKVAVVGAGSSAVDIAALLHEAGAEVHLVGRRREIAFHKGDDKPRTLADRIAAPRSGLGLGWKSRLATDAPLVFHLMPEKLRRRAVQRHLGPAPGWFMRDRVVGRFPQHMGVTVRAAAIVDGHPTLTLSRLDSGEETILTVDHVIAATGFRVAISRLPFLADDLKTKLATADDVPVLSRNFESSVPGLYFVGLASANSFGPLTRFAYGAGFTAKRLSRHLRG